MWDIFLENCQRIRDIFKVGLISRQTNSRSWIHKVTKRIFENSYLRISIVLSIVLYFREMVRIVMDIYMYMTYQITNALKVNWNWELKQYLLFFFFFFVKACLLCRTLLYWTTNICTWKNVWSLDATVLRC